MCPEFSGNDYVSSGCRHENKFQAEWPLWWKKLDFQDILNCAYFIYFGLVQWLENLQ